MTAELQNELRRERIKSLIRDRFTTLKDAAASLDWPHYKLRNHIDRGDPTQLPALTFCQISILAGLRMDSLLDELLKI